MGFFRFGGMAIMMASLAVFFVAALAFFFMSSPAGAQDLGNCPPGYHTVFQQSSNGPPQPSCAADGGGSGGPAPTVSVRVLDKYFGALAYSADTGEWTMGNDFSSVAKAKEGVLGKCEERYGGCRLMLSYANQCAAVANAGASGEDSVNTGSSEENAKANAIKSCRADWGADSCSIVKSGCSKYDTRVVR